MADSTNGRRPWQPQPGAAAIVMIVLAAAMSGLLGAVSLNWYATAGPSAGLLVRGCAGFTTAPRLHPIYCVTPQTDERRRLRLGAFGARAQAPQSFPGGAAPFLVQGPQQRGGLLDQSHFTGK